MSFWKKLFGGGAPKEEPASEPVEHKGFTVLAAPFQNEGQYQTAGRISKEVGGETKTHEFIRADRHASREDAVAFSIHKAKQIIDEQGERIFR